jgi:hypothetical protein
MEKKFYVYVHRRATDGTVFYVGKGTGKRHLSTKWRNIHWHNIVSKHGFKSDVVALFSVEACAFSFEIALIKAYGRENLCNMTDGGEGMSGWRATDETKKKCSEWQIGRTLSDQHKKNISLSVRGIKKSAEFARLISNLKSGKGHHFFGVLGQDNPITHSEKHTFCHDIHGCVTMTKNEFYTKYGLSRSKVSALVLGRRASHKGWSHAAE